MSIHKSRILRQFLFALFLILSIPASRAAETTRSCRIPILTVKDSGGSVVYVKLVYSRNQESTEPLSIAVSEQLPQGSGDELRASIWQAAMVAAIEKKDTLQGVNLYISVPGQIDGPSAGCAFTLAILSAIDGKAFPTNTAVTGSILPDGTIGRVGGVHLKIMAAREAGMKKILVPDYLRLEYDPDKKITIDVKKLATVLGLQFVPVTTVSEAYARLYGSVAPAGRSEDTVELPDSLDTFFHQRYDGYHSLLLNLCQEKASALVVSNQIGNAVTKIISTSQRADEAANMGYFDVASYYEKRAVYLCSAYLQTLADIDDTNILGSIDAVILERQKKASDPLQIARQVRNNGLSTGGSQFLAEIAYGRAFSDYIKTLTLSRDELAASINGASISKDVSKENIQSAKQEHALIEFTRLLFANLINVYYYNYVTNAIDIDASLSYQDGYHFITQAGAENLLYSTYLASKSTLDISLTAACQAAGVDPQKLYTEIIIRNPDAAAAFGTYPAEGHEEIANTDRHERDYLATVLSLSYITAIAQSSRLLISLIELDPAYGADGSLAYGRTGLLHRLLRVARNRAIDSVLNCRDKGLPWVAAALALRKADFSRDDPTEDKTAVLAMYWQASLQANAMTLLIKPDKNTGIQTPRPIAQGAQIKEVLSSCQVGIKTLHSGDVITHMDGVRITDTDELRAIVASMSKKKSYEIRFTAAADGKDYLIKAAGGKMLGVLVENYFSKPPAAPIR